MQEKSEPAPVVAKFYCWYMCASPVRKRALSPGNNTLETLFFPHWVSKMRLATNFVSAAYVRKAVCLGRGRRWRCARVSRVLTRAKLVIKDAVSSLQRPPTSMPKRQGGTLNYEDFWVGSFFGLAGIEECCCGN